MLTWLASLLYSVFDVKSAGEVQAYNPGTRVRFNRVWRRNFEIGNSRKRTTVMFLRHGHNQNSGEKMDRKTHDDDCKAHRDTQLTHTIHYKMHF